MSAPEARLGLEGVSTSDAVTEYRTAINNHRDTLGQAVLYDEGGIALRPVSTAGTPGISGREYRSTDETPKMLYKDKGVGWEPGVPVGALFPFAGASAPGGYLLCDGSAVSRSNYAELFAVLGTTYGSGDGSTTFNVPDLRGRVPVGVDGAANRLTANDALGQSGGEEKHQLTVAELASHQHPAVHFGSSGGQFGVQATSNAGNNDASAVVGSAGGDTPHNNMQPYQVVTYIIKAA